MSTPSKEAMAAAKGITNWMNAAIETHIFRVPEDAELAGIIDRRFADLRARVAELEMKLLETAQASVGDLKLLAELSAKKDEVYVSLMHGRDFPGQELSDWGFDGPIIGPVVLHWTYGTLHLHRPDFQFCGDLKIHEDLVQCGGKFYGDYDVFTGPLSPAQQARVITVDQYVELNAAHP